MVKSLGPAAPAVKTQCHTTPPQLMPFSVPLIRRRKYGHVVVQVISCCHAFKDKNEDLGGELVIPCKALKPCSGTLEEPVTNCSSRALLSSSKDSTAFQNHLTMLLSGVQCFSLVFAFQSEMSIFPKPHTISWRKMEIVAV